MINYYATTCTEFHEQFFLCWNDWLGVGFESVVDVEVDGNGKATTHIGEAFTYYDLR